MVRLYQLLMLLLPRYLRQKHGIAMQQMFERELERARTNGRLPATLAALSGLGDLMKQVAYQSVRMRNTATENSNVELPTTRQHLSRLALVFVTAFAIFTIALLIPFSLRQIFPMRATGAPFEAILTALALSIPFTAAMTIPMAVLLAVLYEYSRLGANGTLAAVRNMHHGVRRLVIPVVVAAVGVSFVAFVVTAEVVPRTNFRLASLLQGRSVSQSERTMTIEELRHAANNTAQLGKHFPEMRNGTETEVSGAAQIRDVASYEIEIQKKFALPTACLLLALLGMAISFRVPRGGMLLVFGCSLTFYLAYYALMVTGETLADNLLVSPFIGTWGANAVVTIVAIFAAGQAARMQRIAAQPLSVE